MCEQSCVPRIGWSCSNAALTIERPSVAVNSRKFASGSSAGVAVCAPAPGTRAQQAPIRHTASDSLCILLRPNLPLVCRIAQRLWLLRVEVALYLSIHFGAGSGNRTCLERNRPMGQSLGHWKSAGFYGWIREEGRGLRDSSSFTVTVTWTVVLWLRLPEVPVTVS